MHGPGQPRDQLGVYLKDLDVVVAALQTLGAELQSRSGNLGELFGTVRQAERKCWSASLRRPAS